MRRLLALLGLLLVVAYPVLSQRTDLSGLKFCIDPGHGGHSSNDRHVIPDPGIDFWESESNFQKALLLKALLEQQGAWVILTRTTNDTLGYPNPDDPDEPSLGARSQLANDNNVDWFHSIHSNAFNGVTNYTLILLKEDIPTRQAAFPEGLVMSNVMAPKIQSFLRTTGAYVRLDYTFYGGPSGGYNLGVLKNLLMPGELSEGSFHDVYAETRRLLNNAYRKLEAYALRNSFLQYYGVPADPLGVIAGIQTDPEIGSPVNSTTVRLLPDDRVYSGDTYNNGFYMFDGLTAGARTVRFETVGRFPDSVSLVVPAAGLVFADRALVSSAPPTVVASTPVQADTAFPPNAAIVIRFSKYMDTASVRAAFSITPPVAGTLTWGITNTQLSFVTDSLLPFLVTFTVKIDTTAKSTTGLTLDGNGDGVAGDFYSLVFRTRAGDYVAPQMTVAYPGPGSVAASQNTIINITFNELLKASTATSSNFSLLRNGRLTASSVEYSEANAGGGVTMYPSSPLILNATYTVNFNLVQDVWGNPVTTPVAWSFSAPAELCQFQVLDSLDASLSSWLSPGGSGSTVGIDSASFAPSTVKKIAAITGNPGSALLKFAWQASAPDYFIREYLNSGPARAILFRKENTLLQAFVHGDGSRTEFRFAVDDSVDGFPGGATDHHEVSPWVTIDWVGWRLVEWDLEQDSVGSWLGNGVLEGQLRFDSFQLRQAPGGSARNGQIYIDQLQLATKVVSGVELLAEEIPQHIELFQNFPNPFNPSTRIRFTVPRTERVRLAVYDLLGREVAVLLDEVREAGSHSVTFDAGRLASGMYVCKLVAPSGSMTKKMLLAK